MVSFRGISSGSVAAKSFLATPAFRAIKKTMSHVYTAVT